MGASLIAASAANAQLVAFPGAEGAGRFAVGGRGGDVYYVQNLNDSGPGSLREGIRTATGARTILFKVAGTIHLLSDLDINKSNVTVAGQTAPGGGITIADRQTRIVNSGATQTHDVILQYVRFRVGDTYTRQVDNTYEPDALWVAGSNNVIVDHVSASWGVDEQLSVTHGSTNVTVQWSMIGEALHNAGHHKGNHGYGSIIHGGETSILHNLYVNNRSRNPAVGGPGGGHLSIVNNVISNPGDRFSYSGDTDDYSMNFVGNYGISGPNTTRTNELFHGDSATARIYYAGNFLDQNKNGLLDGSLAAQSTLTGTHTPLASPTPTPTVQSQTDARQAYIQVLSRAGANYYRDAADRRAIRGVINQTGAHIDSQAEVGGWPTLPTAQAPADSNQDGVPDYFAVSKGFNPSTNIRNGVAPNGYTWLENYLHSLTPAAYSPAAVMRSTLTASADAQVSENGGTSATSSGNGTSTTIATRWNGSGNADRNEYVLLRFDLSQFEPGSITDARLELSAAADLTGTSHKVRVYGLEHDAAGWDWDELSSQFSGAPALEFDDNSATRGLNSAAVLDLGTFDASGLAAGQSIGFDNPNLAVFLNLAAYFEGLSQEGLVTLLLERMDSSNGLTQFSSREAGLAVAPRLVIDAAPVPEPTAAFAAGAGVVLLAARRRRRLRQSL